MYATGEDKKSVVTWNSTESILPSQVRRVTITAMGILSDYIQPRSEDVDKRVDPSDLGR